MRIRIFKHKTQDVELELQELDDAVRVNVANSVRNWALVDFVVKDGKLQLRRLRSVSDEKILTDTNGRIALLAGE